MPSESPTLWLGHLQFEALITTARLSANPNDFALVALLGLLGLRIFEACGSNIADLGEEHGHRVLRVRGKGGKVVLVPLPPAVARAIDQAIGERTSGPILRNTLGVRMDRHAATRRLKHLAHIAGIRMPRMHPHMLRHTFVTTMLDAGVSLRDVQIATRHADPRTTMLHDRAQRTSTGTQLHPRCLHGLWNMISRSRLCREAAVRGILRVAFQIAYPSTYDSHLRHARGAGRRSSLCLVPESPWCH